MATITEKVAYLKGLVEGMDIDQSTKEGKVLTAVMDVLSDLATTLEDLEDYTAELTEQVDAIDEDLDLLESDYYEEWEEDDDYCDGCCDDCDEDCGDEFYDVTCPSCDTTFCVDEETLLEGGIECPNCGENLEFEIEEDEIEEED
ncbi:MAG: hypothetical protein E7549_02330 [Ruminococcaceae bacterium]|nr:hypothetical protein [Oscillospiraceae bacterium]